MINKKTNKYTSKKTVIILLVIFALIGGGIILGVSAYRDRRDGSVGRQLDQAATPEEKEYSNDRKEEAADKGSQVSPPAESGSQNTMVTPVIVDAGQYDKIEVRAFVPGIVERGGSCEFTFTGGSQTVTKTSSAFPDASTTQCTAIEVEKGEFTQAGMWSVVVRYSSAKAGGASAPKSFEVKL